MNDRLNYVSIVWLFDETVKWTYLTVRSARSAEFRSRCVRIQGPTSRSERLG